MYMHIPRRLDFGLSQHRHTSRRDPTRTQHTTPTSASIPDAGLGWSGLDRGGVGCTSTAPCSLGVIVILSMVVSPSYSCTDQSVLHGTSDRGRVVFGVHRRTSAQSGQTSYSPGQTSYSHMPCCALHWGMWVAVRAGVRLRNPLGLSHIALRWASHTSHSPASLRPAAP